MPEYVYCCVFQDKECVKIKYVKIGKTKRKPEKRISEFIKDGYCGRTFLAPLAVIEVKDCDKAENELHTFFSESRLGDTELFVVNNNMTKLVYKDKFLELCNEGKAKMYYI